MKAKFPLSASVLFFLALGLMAFSCSDWQYGRQKGERRVLIAQNEVHEGWFFGGGDEVVIEGTVNGDAYVAGGVVEVDGTINGDLIAAGGMVVVNGKVAEHVRAAGGTIWINGEVGKDASVAGGNIRIGRKGALEGNLLAAGGTVEVGGTVGKDAHIASGDAEISGSVGGSVKFSGNRFTIPDQGHVGGNLQAYVKDKELVKLATGGVAGNVDISIQQPTKHKEILGISAWCFWLKLFWFAGSVVVGLLLVLIAPSRVRQMGTVITKRGGEAAVWGILGVIVIPIASFILMLTLIGIPAALLVLSLFFVILYLSQFGLAVVVAQLIFALEGKGRAPLFGALLAGMAIVEIAVMIPYLGVLVCLAGCVLGVGAILLMGQEEWKLRQIKN